MLCAVYIDMDSWTDFAKNYSFNLKITISIHLKMLSNFISYIDIHEKITKWSLNFCLQPNGAQPHKTHIYIFDFWTSLMYKID